MLTQQIPANTLIPQQITTDVLLEKYAKNGETSEDDIFKRVAKGIASVEKPKDRLKWEKVFYKNMLAGAVGAGRIMSAAGAGINATVINCFAGETTVLTFNGPKLIRDLVGKSELVLTAEGWKKAEFKAFGKQKLFEITFKNLQTVYATAGHDWFVKGKYDKRSVLNNLIKVKTTELLGKKVPILPIVSRPQKDEEYHKGIVHGIIYGDGSRINKIGNSYYCHLFGDKQNLRTWLEKYSQKIELSNSYNVPSLRVYGVNLNETDLKAIPSENESLSYLYGFICGLIATDGNVCSTIGATSIFQNNKADLDAIGKMGTRIGMTVSSVKMYRELSPFDQSVKPLYALRFIKSCMSENDFLRAEQQHCFLNEKIQRVMTNEVISVEMTDREEEVYCAIEPDTHSFVIEGGILTGNCFVQPIGDCIQGVDNDGNPGIYDALREAAETMKRGGGVGYDFSLIRPEEAWVKSIAGSSSGPCSYMDIFDVSCRTIESAGGRRGAQLAALRYNHPDIEKFIVAKRTKGRWNNFNVSVFVNDEFMNLKETDGIIDLIHKEEPSWKLKAKGAHQREDGNWVYKSIRARELWDKIMKSNYDFAEPGILFEDNINKDNNLRYCEYINTTNPCGEQPLPKYGCCDLGPIILTKFVSNPFQPNASFNFTAFATAVKTQVRFLDNVLDATMWPLPQQAKESTSKRRIGLGFTGLANALAMLNVVYYENNGLAFAEQIAKVMRDNAYLASIELAKEKGSFPLLDKEKYLEEGTFASRLPDSIKADIRKYGIRNSHLLSIAPVGTISLAFADNASNGIEPPFSLAYTRKKRMSDGTSQMYPVVDHSLRVYLSTIDKDLADVLLSAICDYKDTMIHKGVIQIVKDHLPKSLVTALEMTADQHLSMMRVVQPYIDSSISKTVNVPKDASFEEFKQIYDNAWKYKLKGVSTYRPNDILGSVLSIEAPKKEVIENKELQKEYKIDVMNSFILERPEGTLPSSTKKVKYTSNYVDDKFYVGVSFLRDIKRPVEVFFTVCPDGVPQEWLDNYALNMSLLARGGLEVFCKALRANRKVKSDKGQIRYGWITKDNGDKVPRFHTSEVACMAFAIQEILIEEGVITEEGFPVKVNSVITVKEKDIIKDTPVLATKTVSAKQHGKPCPECGDNSLIKKDGCSYCTSCGFTGACG